MPNSNLVVIREFDPIGEDERGVTASYTLSRQQDTFIYLTRKAGSQAGNTYHEGKSAATNPKIFVLLQGKVLFSYRHVDETEKHEEEVVAPAIIEIQPRVTHKVDILEDAMFLECNSIADIQNDRHRVEV